MRFALALLLLGSKVYLRYFYTFVEATRGCIRHLCAIDGNF